MPRLDTLTTHTPRLDTLTTRTPRSPPHTSAVAAAGKDDCRNSADDAVLDTEQRAAALVIDDDIDVNTSSSDIARIDDDKTVIVLARNELEPFADDTDDQLRDRLARALQDLRSTAPIATTATSTTAPSPPSDWLVQHEATVTLRRVVVHHPHVIDTVAIAVFVDPVVRGCDNLRSALSKNSLLALAECFEMLCGSRSNRDATARNDASLLFVTHAMLLDVLLRRASCEKQFLRDAAAFAVEQLATHLASWRLITRASAYATTKHNRLCSNAARVVATSLTQLLQRPRVVAHSQTDDSSPNEDENECNDSSSNNATTQLTTALTDSANVQSLCSALAAFARAKDKSARSEAAAAFRVLGAALGRTRLEQVVQTALRDDRMAAARIVTDAFASPTSAAAARCLSPTSLALTRGSLRERASPRHSRQQQQPSLEAQE